LEGARGNLIAVLSAFVAAPLPSGLRRALDSLMKMENIMIINPINIVRPFFLVIAYVMIPVLWLAYLLIVIIFRLVGVKLPSGASFIAQLYQKRE